MLQAVVDGAIWVAERPVRFSGVWLRSRTTVVRLEDGGLWVHSPAEPGPEMNRALAELGPVRWVVVPNRFHHLQAGPTARAHEGARVVGPASVRPRNPGLQLDRELDDPAVAAELPELEPLPLAGVPYLDETCFFHRPTGTLIGADLALCACRKDHWSWRAAARLSRRYGTLKVPPDVRLLTRRRDETARAVQAMLDRPVARILLAHADVIDDRPGEQLARAWRHVLNPGWWRGS